MKLQSLLSGPAVHLAEFERALKNENILNTDQTALLMDALRDAERQDKSVSEAFRGNDILSVDVLKKVLKKQSLISPQTYDVLTKNLPVIGPDDFAMSKAQREQAEHLYQAYIELSPEARASLKNDVQRTHPDLWLNLQFLGEVLGDGTEQKLEAGSASLDFDPSASQDAILQRIDQLHNNNNLDFYSADLMKTIIGGIAATGKQDIATSDVLAALHDESIRSKFDYLYTSDDAALIDAVVLEYQNEEDGAPVGAFGHLPSFVQVHVQRAAKLSEPIDHLDSLSLYRYFGWPLSYQFEAFFEDRLKRYNDKNNPDLDIKAFTLGMNAFRSTPYWVQRAVQGARRHYDKDEVTLDEIRSYLNSISEVTIAPIRWLNEQTVHLCQIIAGKQSSDLSVALMASDDVYAPGQAYVAHYDFGYNSPTKVSFGFDGDDVRLSDLSIRKNLFGRSKIWLDDGTWRWTPASSVYTGSGLHRGHNAANITFVRIPTRLGSFKTLNISPQFRGVNSGAWKALEEAIRNLVIATGGTADIKVLMNYLDENGDLDPDRYFEKNGVKVRIPESCIMAVCLDVDGYKTVLAFEIPNEDDDRYFKPEFYQPLFVKNRISLSGIEKKTGHRLWANVYPASVWNEFDKNTDALPPPPKFGFSNEENEALYAETIKILSGGASEYKTHQQWFGHSSEFGRTLVLLDRHMQLQISQSAHSSIDSSVVHVFDTLFESLNRGRISSREIEDIADGIEKVGGNANRWFMDVFSAQTNIVSQSNMQKWNKWKQDFWGDHNDSTPKPPVLVEFGLALFQACQIGQIHDWSALSQLAENISDSDQKEKALAWLSLVAKPKSNNQSKFVGSQTDFENVQNILRN